MSGLAATLAPNISTAYKLINIPYAQNFTVFLDKPKKQTYSKHFFSCKINSKCRTKPSLKQFLSLFFKKFCWDTLDVWDLAVVQPKCSDKILLTAKLHMLLTMSWRFFVFQELKLVSYWRKMWNIQWSKVSEREKRMLNSPGRTVGIFIWIWDPSPSPQRCCIH